MKVKELIKFLKTQEPEREVVFHEYNGRSYFYPANISSNVDANTKNFVVLYADTTILGGIKPIMKNKGGMKR